MANAVEVELYVAMIDPESAPIRHSVLPLPRETITAAFIERWKQVLEEEHRNTEWTIYTNGNVELSSKTASNGKEKKFFDDDSVI